jgi:hypothetical protein
MKKVLQAPLEGLLEVNDMRGDLYDEGGKPLGSYTYINESNQQLLLDICVQWAKRYQSDPAWRLCLDLETGGLSPHTDPIHLIPIVDSDRKAVVIYPPGRITLVTLCPLNADIK